MSTLRFQVGAHFENEKGPFEVLAIKGESMLIAWDSGERITTSIAMQEKILTRMEKEANAPADRKGTASPSWMGRTFNGLLLEDFKDGVEGTHWRSREQLGGAVTRQLEPPVPFNSWSIYRRPEIHWAAIDRYRGEHASVQAKFFIRLQEETGLFGFYIERSNDRTESRVDWLNLMNWLAVEDHLNWLHQLLEETGMSIFDPYPELELALNRSIRPKSKGWIVEYPDSSTQAIGKAELASHLTEIDDSTWLNLVIGFQRPKEELLEQGVNVAIEIAECFNRLLPIYANRAPMKESKA